MIIKNGVTVIDLDVSSIELECSAYPTIYKFYDNAGQEYMLRMRSNTLYLFTVKDNQLEKLIISGEFDSNEDKYYGITNMDEMYFWLLENEIVLNRYYKDINVFD